MRQVTALTAGISAAFLAVLAQAYLEFQPPQAYGICIVCHGRDLVFWLSNNLLATELPVAAISQSWPLLTVIGIFMGARFAAREHGEYQVQWVEEPFKAFFLGMLVMISGLLAMACPIRLLLRTAYGDVIALAAIIFFVLGVVMGTYYFKWRLR